MTGRRLRGRARRLRRDARGGATIEFVLWLPVLAGFLMVVADLSMLLAGSASMENAARDTARALARGLVTQEGAEAHLRGLLPVGDPASYSVVVATNPEVTVDVTVPVASLAVFGLFNPLLSETFAARAVMRRETL